MPGALDQAEKDFKALIAVATNGSVDKNIGSAAFVGMYNTSIKKKDIELARKTIEDGLNLYPDNVKLLSLLKKLDEGK